MWKVKLDRKPICYILYQFGKKYLKMLFETGLLGSCPGLISFNGSRLMVVRLNPGTQN